jgi:hypothetical protein
MFRSFVSLLVFSIISLLANADESNPIHSKIEDLRAQGFSVKSISPIFGQLVMFSFPKDFNTVFEETKGIHYIRESVLLGETYNKWSQMITVTGVKGVASIPNQTPEIFATGIADRFNKHCPSSFKGNSLGNFKLESYDAFAAVVSCGLASPSEEQYSESALIIVVKGDSDYYTIQWAERSFPSTTPIIFDKDKWIDRYKKLAPIKLCPIVSGEAAPYPSCVNHS